MRVRVRVTVDATRCEGTGFCARLAPEHFAVGGDEVSRVLQEQPSESDLGALREAEALCPTAAIDVYVEP